MGTDSRRDNEIKHNEVYAAEDLQPGGAGKQGDQQEMGQDREVRRDKHASAGGSDKMHVDEHES